MTEATLSLSRIAATLARHLGMASESVGRRALESAVRRRMTAVGLDGTAAYAEKVSADRRELDELVEAVVVPETWFFRYQDSFRHLTRWALERRTPTTQGRTLRVLSAPCATGEEAYSIAIALLEAGLTPGSFRVDAVDVCRRALRIAEAGHYGDFAFREQTGMPRSRFLQVDGPDIVVTAEARSAVHFHLGNLVDPTLFAGEVPFDAIFCRNLFIYLTDAARKTVIESLQRVLCPDGLIYMGHAEPLGLMDSRFRSVAPPSAFAFTRIERPDTPGVSELTPARLTRPSDVVKRPAARLEPIEPLPVIVPPDWLAEARTAADRGDWKAADDLCVRHVTAYGATADALTLLGVIRATSGNPIEAEREFTQALYMDPGHYDALLQMFALAQGRGDAAAVANYRRRIDQAGRREGHS